MKTLRGTFNDLVETLKRWDLYQKDDEVDMDLNELSNIIDEVEKRMQCVTNTNKDIRGILSIYEDVLSSDDSEILQGSVNDIDIALDLSNNEPIDNNWYELFKPKRTIETEVSTETILVPKGSIVEWSETKQYYNVQGGAKARVMQDYTTNNEIKHKCIQVEWLDEKARGQQNGEYERDNFKERFEQPTPPTELCKTPQTHEFVKDIIAKLKVIDVDGETMQYILEQVGMDGQMLHQLIMSCEHLEQVEEIIDEAKTLK